MPSFLATCELPARKARGHQEAGHTSTGTVRKARERTPAPGPEGALPVVTAASLTLQLPAASRDPVPLAVLGSPSPGVSFASPLLKYSQVPLITISWLFSLPVTIHLVQPFVLQNRSAV